MFARIATVIALSALFTGCASYDNGYRDGAYYHRARGSEGDYYYGRPVPANRGYYNPYYGPYGAPLYYSPYPYYRPYRYRPYYGPYRSSYYRSGFGASYAYGGFSGYRDYGHPYFSAGFAYTNPDHARHDRDRSERHGRRDRDDHDQSGHDRHDPRNGRSDRFAGAPIIEGADRRDGRWGRPGYGDGRRAFDRRTTPPVPAARQAPEPAAVHLPATGGRLVQMRRVDGNPVKNKRPVEPRPGPGYRRAALQQPLPAREREVSIQSSSRGLPQANSPQRRLNEATRDGGIKTRNPSQLKRSADVVDE